MALKKSEKQLIGIMLLLGAGAIVMMVGLPSLTGLQASWAKKTELETTTKTLAQTEKDLQSVIGTLEQQMRLPNDITLRKHTPENLQANVKSILDKVLQIASINDNTIIALLPWKDVPAVLPPPPKDTANAAPAAPANGATSAATLGAANAAPAQPVVPPLTVVGYELSMRGTYGSVQKFLQAMSEQKELVEISNIQIVNEQGPDRGASEEAQNPQDDPTSDGPLIDPSKPIKLIAKLRLVLEPEALAADTPPPAAPATAQ